jgi:hypothetical protein
LVLQTGGIEITNIDVNNAVMDTNKSIEEYKKEWFEKVENDSKNLLDIAGDALKNSSCLKRVIVIKRLPRFDRSSDDILSIKSQLSKYGNTCLDQLYIKRGRPENIHVVELSGLNSPGHLRRIVYGEINKNNYDGIHFRGKHASRHFTYRAVQAVKSIITGNPNTGNSGQDNDGKSDFHRSCPQAKFQARNIWTNQKGGQISSNQSNGHQSNSSPGRDRYSDVVKGSQKYRYSVPTKNKFSPLN